MVLLEELKQLISIPAVSGNEQKMAAHLMNVFMKYCDDARIDKFFNVIGYKKGSFKEKQRKSVMITAHLDEIGLIVKSIDDNGFVKFTNIGGVDSRVLLAQEVIVHGKRDIYGVIGAKPPHLLSDDEAKKQVKIDELVIDIGMSGEEVRQLAGIGDIITMQPHFTELYAGRYSSKALDNRAGVAALLEVMSNMANVKHGFDLYFAATVQEEVGDRGAEAAAYNIVPDIAIVIDACHGDMADAHKEQCYTLGKGPAVAVGPNLHKKLTRELIKFAGEEKIPYQVNPEPEDTGTEAWSIQVSRMGIPTLLVSIPVRYMHSTVETVDISDVKMAGRLIAGYIASIEDRLEEMLCY